MYFMTAVQYCICYECIFFLFLSKLTTSWTEDCLVLLQHFKIVWCYFLNLRETQMLCFMCYCYMIMCNLFCVRKNQNLWNVDSCNLFIAIVFAKLVPSLEYKWAGDPCCSLGLCNPEGNWRRTLKWISQKYLGIMVMGAGCDPLMCPLMALLLVVFNHNVLLPEYLLF